MTWAELLKQLQAINDSAPHVMQQDATVWLNEGMDSNIQYLQEIYLRGDRRDEHRIVLE